MTGNVSPQPLNAWMAAIERRLSAMETGARQSRTGQVGGTYKVLDGDPADGGISRVEIGSIVNPAGGGDDFGIIVREPGGSEVFVVGDEGLTTPGIQGNSVSFLADVAKQSNTFWLPVWYTYFWGVTADAVLMHHHVAVPSSGGIGPTTIVGAKMRLKSFSMTVDGTMTAQNTSSERTITKQSGYDLYDWQWLHGVTLDDEKGLLVRLDVIVDSHSSGPPFDAVGTRSPSLVIQTSGSSIGATASGF